MTQEPLLQLTLDLQCNYETDVLLYLTASLRQEVEETDVQTVTFVAGLASPKNSKGDPTTTQLLVTLAVGVIPSLILLIQNFLLRQRDHTLKIKIKEVELEVPAHANPQEIKRIVKIVERLAQKAG